MSLTSVSFDYNVAKVIDTPWNTIINGLNYTKTNLSPLGLKYTLSNNYDTGMLLKEVAGNSIKSGVPIEDFSWSNAAIDSVNPNKYWILNTSHKNRTEDTPAIYYAEKLIDENGFEYSNIVNASDTNKFRNCGQIFYQDSSYMYIYLGSVYPSSGGIAYIHRYEKSDNRLKLNKTYSYTDGICTLLEVSGGCIYYLAQYGSSSINRYVKKIEISSGTESTVGYLTTSSAGVLTSYPSNIVDNEFYVKDMPTNVWYKFTFSDGKTAVSAQEVFCNDDVSVLSSTGISYCGQVKRFNHIYVVNNEKYLASITLNSYSYSTNKILSTIQLYKITELGLEKVQNLEIDGLSLIAKNDWNALFIGTSAGLKVFTWDKTTKNFIERPSIYTTIQQFGFDLDERLWIMDGTGGVYRYTYNQPSTVDYKFEYERYKVGTEPIKSYIDVKSCNYMGESLTTKVILKCVGNFTFENDNKELQVNLSSDNYTRIPIYITGSGKYEIRI